VMRVVRDAAERTGRKAMIAFNLTGDLDEMRRRHDLVVAEGGTAIMASLHSVGFVGMIELARHSALPIHGHRNGWGYLSRHPALGFDYAPWQMLWRLAGADHLHVNGLSNKFSETDESVIASARAVLAPLFPDRPMVAMPVFSSGQTARQAAPTYAAVGTTDLIFAAGGGIFGHPRGVRAGVAALRRSWEAAVEGISLEDLARRDQDVALAAGIGR
jgi:ribulose-bisphosphate carboxylase large chain